MFNIFNLINKIFVENQPTTYGYPHVPQYPLFEATKYKMDTVTYNDNSIYSYQTPPVTSTPITDDFLIASSMVKDYGYLSSIEVYGHVNGTITLNVIVEFL